MPVLNEQQLNLMKSTSRCKRLERRVEELEQENEELRNELADAVEKKKTMGHRWCHTLQRSTDRAKQLEAIRMIMDGEWVLDTRYGQSKIVKSDKPIGQKAFYRHD